MAVKFFVLCAAMALVNTIAACPCGSSQVLPSSFGGCGLNTGFGGFGYGSNGLGYNAVSIGSGGGLGVASASALAPNGISIVSNNAIEGILEVTGAAPLLAAVALEGNVPSAGAAGTSYSCGNGNVGISADSLAAAGLAAGNGLAGYGAGLGLGAYGAGNIGYGAGNIGYGSGNIGYGVGNIGYGVGNLGFAGADCECRRY